MTHYLDLDNPDDRAALAEMIGVGQQKANRELPIPRIEFAEVTGYGKVPEQALPTVMVSLPGSNEQIEAVNVLPSQPEHGDRVMIMFVPPHGVYVIGSVPAKAGACWAASHPFDSANHNQWGEFPRQPLLDVDTLSIYVISCGFELIDGAGLGLLDTLVFPASGVYVASYGAMVQGGAAGSTVTGSLTLDNEDAEQVISYDERLVDASQTAVLNGRSVLFYAEAGDQLWMAASSDDPNFAVSEMFSGISVWAHCCDYVPGEVVPGPE